MKTTAQKLEIPTENDPSFRWAVVAFLVLAELMLYTPSLVHGLVADDFTSGEFPSRPLSSFWSAPSDLQGHWRPLSYSVKHVLFSLFAETPFPWHAINLLIHLISVLVFFQILEKVSPSEGKHGLIGPLIATVMFQAHPAAVQNVYWASGLSDLLCMLFLLLATLCSVAPNENRKTRLMLLTPVLFSMALLSKESAIVFPVFLAFLLRLMIGSWQPVLKLHGRMLGVLTFLSILFGAIFIAVSGQLLLQSGLLAGAVGIFARGFGMLVIPTDAMRIYQLGAETPLAAAGLGALMVFILILMLRKGLLNKELIVLFTLALLASFVVYVVGRYISLRLMYGSVGFFIVAMFIVLTRRPWWTGPDVMTRVLRWGVILYGLSVLFFSFSAVLDWHVADKFAKAIRGAFVDFHLAAQEKQYVFGAIPSRLRQAEIVGEAATDFRGELRKDEIPDSVDLRSLLRIVLLDRDDVSSNVLIIRNTVNSLILSTQTENQYFLIGDLDFPNTLPVGTRIEEGGFAIEVLHTILDDRAVTVKVTAKDPADLDRLLFFDDQERQFVPLQEIEPVSEDETNE